MNTTALYCNEYLIPAQSCILSLLNVHKIQGSELYGCPDTSRDTVNSSEVAKVYADLFGVALDVRARLEFLQWGKENVP